MADPNSRRGKGPTSPEENAAAFAMVKEMYRGHPLMIRKMRRLILEGKSMRRGKCDLCAEQATVSVDRLRDGEVISRRYCTECAAEAGVPIHGWALRAARRERLGRARAAKKGEGVVKKVKKKKTAAKRRRK